MPYPEVALHIDDQSGYIVVIQRRLDHVVRQPAIALAPEQTEFGANPQIARTVFNESPHLYLNVRMCRDAEYHGPKCLVTRALIQPEEASVGARPEHSGWIFVEHVH